MVVAEGQHSAVENTMMVKGGEHAIQTTGRNVAKNRPRKYLVPLLQLSFSLVSSLQFTTLEKRSWKSTAMSDGLPLFALVRSETLGSLRVSFQIFCSR